LFTAALCDILLLVMEQQSYDLIIAGAGAAGLSAAIYAARSNLSTLLVDAGGISGGQALNILELENYPGLYPFQSGAALIEAMEKQAKAFGASFKAAGVTAIKKNANTFTVSCGGTDYTAKAVIAATGGSPRKLMISGEAEYAGRGVSYCASCDGPFFRGKHVAVIGGGNSACGEALYLSTLASRVTLIHRRETFRADPLEVLRVTKEPKIRIAYNTIVKEIRGTKAEQGGAKKVTSLMLESPDGKKELELDGVFIFIGFIPQTEIAGGAKKDEEGYLITGEDMQTSVAGLFCAGDARSKPFRQIISAASDGAIAAHSAGKYLHNLSCGT
jgi:thioredoxin reductase (NADPH)